MNRLKQLQEELRKLADIKRAQGSLRFFKTAKGQYGAGDKFIGVNNAGMRKIAKRFYGLPFPDLAKLLKSEIHEERQTPLFILVKQYAGANNKNKKKLVEFYLKNAKQINNWDLVDLSCHYILGDYLLHNCPPSKGGAGEVCKPRQILYRLAGSKNLWEKRIAIISTYAFIRNKEFSHTLKIAEILLHDEHDLIHKAVGWMLREAGKRDQTVLEQFLNKHYKIMPRTMLRYAIEKLSEGKRKYYLKK